MSLRIGSDGAFVLAFLAACHVVGLLLFCNGFLLRRVVVPEYSSCSFPDVPPSAGDEFNFSPQVELEEEDTQVHYGHSCNEHPRDFKRVVWLLVDALRYDFTIYDESLHPVPPYRNKMPFVRDLLRDRPENAKLFRFVADPPTTTMQRLKALTTGSLPTFIDISSNFNSYEILEDSILYQAKNSRLNVTFIGDDTWLGLYPNLLTKVYDYPSLNVKDLHTVDNGVIDHMIPELWSRDADILIGHFLGVDHVGHTYGPSHYTMAEKLEQMNGVLKSIFAEIDNDTIVFVFGDHGMTSTGDHGGETDLETDAALLVYTPRPLFVPDEPSGRSVYQVDLVPTVCLLIGLPIPYSNLGMVIPEVFLPYRGKEEEGGWDDGRTVDPLSSSSTFKTKVEGFSGFGGRATLGLLSAMKANALQINSYLKAYTKHSDDFSHELYDSLEVEFEEALKLHDAVLLGAKAAAVSSESAGSTLRANLTGSAEAYARYMRDVRQMCQSVWAKFDNDSINKGLFLLFLSICLALALLIDTHRSVELFCSSLAIGLALTLALGLCFLYVIPVGISLNGIAPVITHCALCWLVLSILTHFLRIRHFIISAFFSLLGFITTHFSLLNVVCVVVPFLYSLSLLSNSFILYEGDTVTFLLQTTLVALFVHQLRGCVLHAVGISTVLKKTFLPFFLLMTCVRASKLFHSCRDLQVGCEISSLTLALSAASEFLSPWGAMLRFLLSSVCTCAVPLSFAWYACLLRVKKRNLLNKWLVVLMEWGLPASSLCVCGFWCLQSLPHSTLERLPSWQHVLLPRTVYLVCGTAILLAVFSPYRKWTWILGRTGNKPMDGGDAGLPCKEAWRGEQEEGEGEGTSGTVVSSIASTFDDPAIRVLPLMVVLLSLWLTLTMLLRDGLALSSALMVAQVFLFFCVLSHSGDTGIVVVPSWPLTVVWSLMSMQYFFALGHHATVTSLRFEAAFTGLHGEVTSANLPLAGFLVGLHTLGSQVLFALGLPVLVVLVGRHVVVGRDIDGHDCLASLLLFSLQYSTFHSFKMFTSVLAASIHRRHLMIWGVFSPRFMYEGAFQATTNICLLAAYILISKTWTQVPKMKSVS